MERHMTPNIQRNIEKNNKAGESDFLISNYSNQKSMILA